MWWFLRALTDRDQGEFGGIARLIIEAQRGGRDAEGDVLARAVEAQKLVLLVERDDEVLHGTGTEVGQRESGIDLDPGPVEGDVAEADVRGQPGHLDLEACGKRLAFGEYGGLGGKPELRDEPFRKAQSRAAGVDLRVHFPVANGEAGDGHAVRHAKGQDRLFAVRREFAGGENHPAVDVIESQEEIPEEGEAEHALAGTVAVGKRVFDGLDGIKVDAADAQGVDLAKGAFWPPWPVGSLSRASPATGRSSCAASSEVTMASPPVPVSTMKRNGPLPLIVTMT